MEDSPRKFIWSPHLTDRLSTFPCPVEKHNSPEGIALLEKTTKSEETFYLIMVIMDGTYEGDTMRKTVVRLEYAPVVPPKKNRKVPWEYDMELYKQYNEIERFFLRLKRFRRVFSRYDNHEI